MRHPCGLVSARGCWAYFIRAQATRPQQSGLIDWTWSIPFFTSQRASSAAVFTSSAGILPWKFPLAFSPLFFLLPIYRGMVNDSEKFGALHVMLRGEQNERNKKVVEFSLLSLFFLCARREFRSLFKSIFMW